MEEKKIIIYDEATPFWRYAETKNQRKMTVGDVILLLCAWGFGTIILWGVSLGDVSFEIGMIISAVFLLFACIVMKGYLSKHKKHLSEKSREWTWLELELWEEGLCITNLHTGEKEIVSQEAAEEDDVNFYIGDDFILQKKYLKQKEIIELRKYLKSYLGNHFQMNISESEEYVEWELGNDLRKVDIIQYAKEVVDHATTISILKRGNKKRYQFFTDFGIQVSGWVILVMGMYKVYTQVFSIGMRDIILLLLYIFLLFKREFMIFVTEIIFAVKLKNRKRNVVKRLAFSPDGITVTMEKGEKSYTWQEMNYVTESEFILNIGGKITLLKEGNSPQEVERAQRYLKEHLDEKYVFHRSAKKASWWRMALMIFLFLFVLVESVLAGENSVSALHIRNKWSEENTYFEYTEEEEPYTYQETVKTGTISIRDGVFMEKVENKSKLLLNKEYINWNDIYYTNVANENTHLQIRSGVLYGESYNGSGQLGLGHKETDYNAKGFCPAYEIDSEVLSCGVGETFIAYIKQNGNLYAIGEIKGQAEMPSATLLMTDVVFMDCGQKYILSIKKDGSVWILGQQGKENDRENPTVIYSEFTKIFEKAIFISAGRYTSAVILDDNSLWIWGDNTYGQCAKEAADEFISAENAVRVPGEYKWVWNDLPEFDSAHNYIADPNLDQNIIVLNNYRTYMQKVDGSLVVCGKDVTEAVLMPLEFY